MLGRKFVLLNEPFINVQWLKGAAPEVDILDPERYSSPEATTECIRAEVYDLVPRTLHPYLEKETAFGELVRFLSFCSSVLPAYALLQFRGAGGSYLRQLVLGLRRDSAGHCFGMIADAELYKCNNSEARANKEEFKRLIRWDDQGDDEIEYLLPLHFPRGDRNDMGSVFKVKWMSLVSSYCTVLVFLLHYPAQMLRSFFYGPTSIEPQNLGNPSWKPTSGNGRKWGLTSVTPGSLALAAVLVRAAAARPLNEY